MECKEYDEGGGLQAHQTGLLDFNTFSLFWRPEFETVSH